ncbi:MAG: Transcriptional regulator, partial [uncultured Acetobacteraceae bacterium]
GGAGARTAPAGRADQEVGYSRIPGLLGGRQEAEDAEAALADLVQSHAGSVSGKVGSPAGLSHGRPELRQASVLSGEEDRPRHQTARPSHRKRPAPRSGEFHGSNRL